MNVIQKRLRSIHIRVSNKVMNHLCQISYNYLTYLVKNSDPPRLVTYLRRYFTVDRHTLDNFLECVYYRVKKKKKTI